MALWTLEEGVALSLGKSPKIANRKTMEPWAAGIPTAAKRYVEVHDLALRAVETGELNDPTRPDLFIDWARRLEIAFPEELEALVRRRIRRDVVANEHIRVDAVVAERAELAKRVEELEDQIAQLRNERPRATKERHSLLTLVIGMAVGAYKYDPKKQRTDITAEIEGDLEMCGLHLDRDTILKWLREAAKLLPPDPDKS